MRRPLRIACVVLGLPAAVYGSALFTGGWLGTPPHHDVVTVSEGEYSQELYPPGGLANQTMRELGGLGLAVAGLTLTALGAWPRRPRPTPAPPKAIPAAAPP